MFAISVLIFQMSCKKEANAQTNSTGVSDQVEARVCDVKGVYLQEGRASNGETSRAFYTYRKITLQLPASHLKAPNDTFDGYRNTCDSLFISVYTQRIMIIIY
jgi:hypothetical protein